MIPKKIHYCWFGGNPLQAMHEECIASWKQILPDYEIVRWDETNSPLEASAYVRDAYQSRCWAFVADYVRIHVLLQEGGIYMDTDMLLLKPLNEFMEHQAFAGFENEKNVAFGIFGTERALPLMKECLDCYDRSHFDLDKPVVIPKIISNILRKHGMQGASRQRIADVDLYPPEVFYPWPFRERIKHPNYRDFITPESYAVHLWNHSWKRPQSRVGKMFRKLYRYLVKPLLPDGGRKN